MTFIDITVPLDRHTIVWEGEKPPEISWEYTLEKDGTANVSRLSCGVHTGTHMDAPYHFDPRGKKADQVDLSVLMGRAWVAETRERVISAQVLDALDIQGCERLLLNTGSSKLYEKKTFSRDFCALDRSGALWLTQNNIRLVGIDYLSIEHLNETLLYPVHQILSRHDIIVLEGLDLRSVDSGWYRLMALPLKLRGTEAAPVRALLLPDEADSTGPGA